MKKNNLLRRVLLALLICLLLCPAALADGVELNRNGSITLKLTDSKGSAASGGEYWLFRVGDPVVRSHNLCFELTGDFVPTGVSLDDLSSSTAAEALATYAELHPELRLQSRTADRQGRVVFSAIPCGLYLIAQKNPGFHYAFERMNAFMAAVPMTNEDGTGWLFDVTARPKVEKKPPRPPERRGLPLRRLGTANCLRRVFWCGLCWCWQAWALGCSQWAGICALQERNMNNRAVQNQFKRRVGAVCMALGALLLLGAAAIICENRREEAAAGREASAVLEQLQAELNAEGAGLLLPEDTANPERLSATPSPDQPKAVSSDGLLPEMPTLTIDGRQYIGYLELPTLGISLPILSDWSYAKLRVAPCRYWGSVYDGSMVLLGHNYLDHFGRLKSLELGDPIQFIDADGNIYRYEVVQQETLEKTDVDAMLDSPYDLTLFTCAHGGERRIVVRARGRLSVANRLRRLCPLGDSELFK